MKRTAIKRGTKPMKRGKLRGHSKTARRKAELAADKLWGLIVRGRDGHICQLCGKPGNQPHHIFPRNYKQTRHDPDNGICLCWACHKHKAHGRPEEFRDFIIARIGQKTFDNLKAKAYNIGADYDPVANCEILKGMEGGI